MAIGRPLPTHEEIQERLSKKKALAIFSSDPISSSAWATEEILRVLVLARSRALLLSLPPAAAIALLLVGYVMTVAVSTSSAVQQLTSAFPTLASMEVGVGILLILRAFASSSVALTGTEAVANGVPALKPPEDRDAAAPLTTNGPAAGRALHGHHLLGRQLRPGGHRRAGDEDRHQPVVAVVIPLTVLAMLSIARRYRVAERKLAVAEDAVIPCTSRERRAVVPVAGIDRSVVQAIDVALSILKEVLAALITGDRVEASRMRALAPSAADGPAGSGRVSLPCARWPVPRVPPCARRGRFRRAERAHSRA